MYLLRRYFWLVVLCGFISCTPTPPDPPLGQFEDTLVASVPLPTAFAFTPDGRLLITSKNGQVYVYRDGLLEPPALDLSSRLCSNSERGLLGVAVDPAFRDNRFIYLYYTFDNALDDCPTEKDSVPVNRVSRFVLSDANTIDVQTETILVDNIPSFAGNHNAGDLHFGKDGYLYISVGDGGCDVTRQSGCAGANAIATSDNVLLGKILRITKDGTVPPDNPFLGSNSTRCNETGAATSRQVCQEIYGTGLRNPFRLAFDENSSTTRFYINDVGQDAWEEINLGQAGANYGWNTREGTCENGSATDCPPPPPNLLDPTFAYRHGDWEYTDPSTSERPFQNCNSITGGAFVPNGVWPQAFDNTYLFADFICGRIFSLKEGRASLFREVARPIHLSFGPFEQTQALYYTTFAGNGQIRRIAYVND
jgi:glucose/arabinose dehydrogenase